MVDKYIFRQFKMVIARAVSQIERYLKRTSKSSVPSVDISGGDSTFSSSGCISSSGTTSSSSSLTTSSSCFSSSWGSSTSFGSDSSSDDFSISWYSYVYFKKHIIILIILYVHGWNNTRKFITAFSYQSLVLGTWLGSFSNIFFHCSKERCRRLLIELKILMSFFLLQVSYEVYTKGPFDSQYSTSQKYLFVVWFEKRS